MHYGRFEFEVQTKYLFWTNIALYLLDNDLAYEDNDCASPSAKELHGSHEYIWIFFFILNNDLAY